MPRIVSETGEDLVYTDPESDLQDKQQSSNNNEVNFSGSDFEDLEDSVGSPLFDLDEEAKKELDEMLQSTAPPYHHAHPHGHPHAHPHPHSHHHAAAAAHHHAHHAHHAAQAAAAAHQRAVQQASANYATVGSASGSAFQRQPPTSAGFHHGHHQVSTLSHSPSPLWVLSLILAWLAAWRMLWLEVRASAALWCILQIHMYLYAGLFRYICICSCMRL